MDNTNNSNTEPHDLTRIHKRRGNSSKNTSPTGMTTEGTVANVNPVSMDDMSAAYLLLSLRYGNNSTPHQDLTPGCSTTENTAREDKMDIDESVNSSCLEADHRIASNSHTGQAQRNPNSTSTFVCDLRQAHLKNELNLRRHKRFVHGGEQKELCGICGARFRSKRYLTVHQKDQHPGRFRRCEVCHRQFKTLRGFQNHTRNFHKRNVCCGVCNATFNTMNGLLFHMQQQHSDKLITRGGVTKKNVMPKFDQKRTYCEPSSTPKDGLDRLFAAINSNDSC